MEEVIYSFGCIAALIVLPILFFSLSRVKRANRTLSMRVSVLENAVAELRAQLLSGFQLGSQAIEAATANTDRVTDTVSSLAEEISTIEPRDEVANESPSAEQPSVGSPTGQPILAPPAADVTGPADIPHGDIQGEIQGTGMLQGISPVSPSPTSAQSSLAAGSPQNAETQVPARPPVGATLFGWFTKMHLMVQIGLLILFIGVAFLIKLVADQGMLSIELRLLISAIFGLGLTGVGWRLRNRAHTYGMALMGGGLAIDYLTTYGAMLYTSFPPTLAFPVFVLLGAVGAFLAVMANAQILAFLALVGAFLAPLLASTGQGSHITLFSYYAVINVGILGIAWFKAWRTLNIAGYFFTMVVGLFWGLRSYTPELFSSTEFFLILFYLLYVLIAVLFAARKAAELKVPGANAFTRHDAVDVTLIFGNPLVAFTIQSALMQGSEYGMAISTFAAGVMYALLAVLFVMRWRSFRAVAESFLFLAGLLIALSVPLTFGVQTTSATWAIMGLAWVWTGSARGRWWQIGWGVLIQLAAAIALISDLGFMTLLDAPAFLNGPYMGALLISLTAYGSGYLIRRFNLGGGQHEASSDAGVVDKGTATDDALETTGRSIAWQGVLSVGLTMWAHLWWFCGGFLQVVDFVNEQNAPAYLFAATFSFVALSAGIAEWVGARLTWSTVRLPTLVLMPLLLGGVLLQSEAAEWPFANGGWYAWPLGLGIAYWSLYRWDRFGHMPWFAARNDLALSPGDEPALQDSRTNLHHVMGLWTISWLLTWTGLNAVELWSDADGWRGLALIGVPTLISWLVVSHGERFGKRIGWPIQTRSTLYQTWGVGPLLGAALIMGLGFNATPGITAPLPYIPLLNPLDLVQIAFFIVAFVWVGRSWEGTRTFAYWTVGIAAFLAFNAGLARAGHHVLALPFDISLFTDSSILQTIYAVSWSMVALVLMFLSHRKGEGWRGVWTGGAIVLGLTVVKLFAIDLANSGTIARIVSFIGTGLLIIVIAYFAPAPHRHEVGDGDAEDNGKENTDTDGVELPYEVVPQS